MLHLRYKRKQPVLNPASWKPEFYPLLNGITEVEFLEEMIHLTTQLTKEFSMARIFQFCDNSSAAKIVSLFHEQTP
jgi:hypothetical protein